VTVAREWENGWMVHRLGPRRGVLKTLSRGSRVSISHRYCLASSLSDTCIPSECGSHAHRDAERDATRGPPQLSTQEARFPETRDTPSPEAMPSDLRGRERPLGNAFPSQLYVLQLVSSTSFVSDKNWNTFNLIRKASI